MKVIPTELQYKRHFNLTTPVFSSIENGDIQTECYGFIRTDLDIFIVNCTIDFHRKDGKYDGGGYEILNVSVYPDVLSWFHQEEIPKDKCFNDGEVKIVDFVIERLNEGYWFNDLIRPYLDPYIMKG